MNVSTIPEAAKQYRQKGWTPIPLAGKNPSINGAGWQKRTYDDADFDVKGVNLGILLGEPSGGLVDVDLDSPEARKVATFFLPDTQTVFGRDQVGPSHLLYVTDKRLQILRLIDPVSKEVIAEYRDGTMERGAQTMFPPSKHPDTGETLCWYCDGEPAQLDACDLLNRFKCLAAAALLAAYWPEKGARHDAANALSGGLVRMGWGEEEVLIFIKAISFATGDEERRDRRNCATYTAYRTNGGDKTTGWPTLSKLLKGNGTKIVSRVCDWLGSTIDRSETRKSKPNGSAQENAENHDRDSGGRRKSKSQASRLVELVGSEDVELFHDRNGTAYASLAIGDHRETWRTSSKAFKDFLWHEFYRAERSALNAQAIREAISTLEAEARFEGPQRDVFVRVAEVGGKIYLDLADAEWRAVEVSREGWKVVENPQVYFRRPRYMAALPEPVHGGKVKELQQFLNLADGNDFQLVSSYMVSALRAEGPYPILCFIGEHGAAKSTNTLMLVRLIDPYEGELRGAPRNEHDLIIAAANSHVLAFDNLSKLPAWLSDAMCRLSTGGGLSTRELYSDDEEIVFDVQRPQLVNSIKEVATRPDFLDRAIIITPPSIDDTQRQDKKALWESFENARPRILGVLLTALSAALRNLDSVQLVRKPRMADFALWSVAAEQEMGFAAGSFSKAYGQNRGEAEAVVLEAYAIVPHLTELVEKHAEWTGTATGLLKELNAIASLSEQKNESWPATPSGLSGQLRELAPTLRGEKGISCVFLKRQNKVRRIQLTSVAKTPSAASPTSPDATGAGSSGDGEPLAGPPGPSVSDRKQSPSDCSDGSDGLFPTFEGVDPGATPAGDAETENRSSGRVQ